MLELNPQLQSKVFDSLLLHMQADRKHPAAGSAGSSSAARRRAARPASRVGSPAWEHLALDLRRLGLDKTTTDALVSWANTQAQQSRRSPVKIRVLHPMEREFISVAAYDYILELYRLGLMDSNSMETLLENCAFLTNLPASKEQVQKMALRSFSEALDSAGLGQSH
jgi:hypothetical protein